MFTCKLLFPLGGLAIILRWQTWPVGNSMNLRPQLQDWLPLCEKLQTIWSCDISGEIRTLITQYLRWEIVFQACPTYKIEYSFFTFNCFDRWFTRLKTCGTVQRLKRQFKCYSGSSNSCLREISLKPLLMWYVSFPRCCPGLKTRQKQSWFTPLRRKLHAGHSKCFSSFSDLYL